MLTVMILLPQKLWYDCPFYLQLGKANHNDARHLITHNLPKAIITEKTSPYSDEVFSGGPSRTLNLIFAPLSFSFPCFLLAQIHSKRGFEKVLARR